MAKGGWGHILASRENKRAVQVGRWANGVCRHSQCSTSKESWTHTIGKATAETGERVVSVCSRLEDEVEARFGQWHWQLDS